MFRLPLESAITVRERASKAYSVSAYILSKTLSELPRTALICVGFVSISYWMIGLRQEAGPFFILLLTQFLTVHTAESIALATSAPFSDPQTAANVAPIPIVMSFLFAGFLITPDAMPVWLRWLRFCSFLYYGYNAAMLNEFRDPGDRSAVLDQYGVNGLGIAANLALLFAVDAFLRVATWLLLRRNGPKFVK